MIPMTQALQAFMKRPTTIIGIGTALLFQLIFSVVWMTGYDGITDRTDQLRIGVVNEDQQLGAMVAANLAEQLPVQVQAVDELAAAERMLDERELQMVVHIPADFSARAQAADQTAEIAYTINESNASLIKSMMSGIAGQITATVNKQAIAGGAAQMLAGLELPEQQAQQMAGALSERVASEFKYTNPVQGVNNQMVPMMMVLASYVGAMIMGMNLEQSNMAVAAAAGRWQRFGARVVINLVSSVIVSLVGTSLVMALGGQAESGFLAMWGFQALFILTFMFVSQLFLIVFGMGGMLFNIMLLSAQLVSSGAMMPRELLSDFYNGLSWFFPATYAVEGSMNLLFGGPDIGDAAVGLLLVLAVATVLGIAATAVRKSPKGAPAVMPAMQGR
jgi:YhgE/Pip-like protein